MVRSCYCYGVEPQLVDVSASSALVCVFTRCSSISVSQLQLLTNASWKPSTGSVLLHVQPLVQTVAGDIHLADVPPEREVTAGLPVQAAVLLPCSKHHARHNSAPRMPCGCVASSAT